MKALLCPELKAPEKLYVGEVDEPTPGMGEAVIRVCAAGVNFPDYLVIQGQYQFPATPPFIPGAEVAGWVESLGRGVTNLQVGDRVLFIGVVGGMAEKAIVNASSCIRLPDDVPLHIAATLGMAYGTTIYALEERAALQSGETLAVLGAAGGVGLAAVKIGKAMGARVIAAASTAEKRQLCLDSGADDVIDYVNEDLKKELKSKTSGSGADVVYDPVGDRFTEPALRATAWGGRYLILGWAAGDIPRIPTNLVLLKGCAIVGVFWGSFAARDPNALNASFQRLFALYRTGAVLPHIGQRYSLDDAADAIRAIGGRAVHGKVLIDVCPEHAT